MYVHLSSKLACLRSIYYIISGSFVIIIQSEMSTFCVFGLRFLLLMIFRLLIKKNFSAASNTGFYILLGLTLPHFFFSHSLL